MKDSDCVKFLQYVLPRLGMSWPGFRKVRRQVCKRVDRRIRDLGLEDVTAYREYLDRHAPEWLVLDKLCRISISRFYRDKRVFDLLRNEVLPQLAVLAASRGDCRIQAWSAGIASGEEVYSLKLVWELGVHEQFPSLSLDITATDAEPKMLERACLGQYQHSSVKDLPKEWMEVAFRKSGDEFSVNAIFREGIRFLLQDIRREQPAGPFDLILCRHVVFTYFDQEVQEEVSRQMVARLRAGGALVIGKQESLPPSTNRDLQILQPHSGIYVRRSAANTC